MIERTINVVVSVTDAVYKFSGKPSTKLSLGRLWLSLSQFSRQKGPICTWTDFHTPLPQSRTSEGSEGILIIRYLPYLVDIASADFFLIRRVKLELAGLLLSQDSIKARL
jgi:hypothetical protein